VGLDPDFNPEFSRMKKGGYQWAGGWIDPSVPATGRIDHPTMSVSDSNKRYEDFQSRMKSDAMMVRALYEAEGSAY